jgi:hypothetical protein
MVQLWLTVNSYAYPEYVYIVSPVPKNLRDTHIDITSPISHLEIVDHTSLVQMCQIRNILHSIKLRWVHRRKRVEWYSPGFPRCTEDNFRDCFLVC